MLAAIALHLLALAQVPSPGAALAEEGPTSPPGTAAPSETPARSTRERQLSLLSATPLGGGSAALVEAGWPSIGARYAQGLSSVDDLGALLDFDWSKTELRLGAFYRRPLEPLPPMDTALRLSLAWYADFGGEWIHSDNRGDRGFEITPALVFSRQRPGGVFAGQLELPITITVRHGGGLLLAPRLTFSYEAPLYGAYTVGVRGGFGYRFGAGSAPLRDGLAEIVFLVVGGYRVF
jgi:hypothetical protein